MKKNRKLTALLVAACMTLPMAATTFTVPMVASGASITISDPLNKNANAENMKAYQVFTGTYVEEDDEGVLTITGWGNDFQAVEFIKALKGDTIFEGAFNSIAEVKNEATAQQVATVIATYNNDANKNKAEAVARYAVQYKGGDGTKATGSGGNYAINGLPDGYYVIVDSSAGIDEALTLGLLQVAGSDSISVTPKRVVPTVTKTAKEDDADDSAYSGVVDCYKGEKVDFKVEVDVPDLSKYTDYYLEIVDTLGSDFNSPTDVVLKNGSGAQISDDTNCDIETSGNVITIRIENAKTYSKQKLTLEYSAVLNKNATTGNGAFDNETQINKVFVKYLNDPNNAWKPADNTGVERPNETLLSSTKDSVVRAYTYQLQIDKYNSGNESEKLKDAEFVLKDSAGKYAKRVNIDGELYEIQWVDSVDDDCKFITKDGGIVNIVGLDAGTYNLEETKAPAGYNRLTAPIEVIITPDYTGTPLTLNTLSGKVNKNTATADKDKGEITVKVANNKGAQLPSTGGIGTKIFYILGGTLVIGSGAALVIKKRMSKDEE